MRSDLVQFFKRPVRILIYEKPAWLWMFVSFGIYGFAVLVYFTLGFIKEHEFLFSLYILGALVCEILFPILFYILVRAMISSLSHFTIFTLVIAAFSFQFTPIEYPAYDNCFRHLRYALKLNYGFVSPVSPLRRFITNSRKCFDWPFSRFSLPEPFSVYYSRSHC